MHKKIYKYLDILTGRSRFLGGVVNKTKNQLAALEQIGDIGTAYDAQYIVRYVFSNNDLVAQKSATIVRKLLLKNEVKVTWFNLSNSFSIPYDCLFNKNDFKIIANFSSEEAIHLYGIASFNRSGYIRESAIDCIGNFAISTEIIPYILLRLNDWVPQVRDKARTILLKNLLSIPIIAFVKHHNLIEWLTKTKRVNLTDIQNQIFAQISSLKSREELIRLMQQTSLKESLFCWKVLAPEITKDDNLIDQAISDPNPEIRQWAVGHLVCNIHFKQRLKRLFADKAFRVRYEVLKRISREIFTEYREFYETAIFDQSKPIREYTRFILRVNGDNSCRDKYRNKIIRDKEKADVGAIMGLAEIAMKEDIELIQIFVNSKNAKIKVSILSALHRLGVKDIESHYLRGLQNQNAKVRNISVYILKSGYGYLKSEIKDVLRQSNIKSQKAALKILVSYGGLDALENILFSLNQSCDELKKESWKCLISWYRQNSSRLWFRFSDETYNQTLKLLNELRADNLQIPSHIFKIWQDLPNIMQTIKSNK